MRMSVCVPGDLKKGFELGGNACPTDTATRAGELSGVVDVLEGFRDDWEWECECEDRGVGLVAVLVTIVMFSFISAGKESNRFDGTTSRRSFLSLGIHFDHVLCDDDVGQAKGNCRGVGR